MPQLRSEDEAWRLRQLCSRKGTPAEEVVAFISGIPEERRANAVQQGNSNGKTPLHYAAQLRPNDGAYLCSQLLSAAAQLDATTRRGHTPLLFAAGRGHQEVVRFLLSARANPRIIAASGEAPWNCASPHLDPETRRLLTAAEASDARTLIDYRLSADALQAQAEYERASLACRARRVEDGHTAGSAEDGGAGAEGEVSLARAILHSLDAEPSESVAVTAAVVAAAVEDKFALRTALRMLFAQEEVAKVLLPLLTACREEQLLGELQKRSRRVRNAAATRIVTALFIEIRNTGAAKKVSVTELVNASLPDIVLTMEVLYAHGVSAETKQHFRQWWERATTLAREGKKYFGELAWAIVGHQQNQGRQRQFALCRDWVLLLRWAALLGPEKLEEVLEMAAKAGRGALLAEILEDMAFPEDIKTRLQEFLEQHNLSFSLKPKLCGELGHHRSRPSPDLPLYEVTQEVLWVDRAEELQRIQQTLESHVAVQAASAQSGRALQVGVDSEWGSQPEAGPSVVQLAISGTIWVIDALAISSQLSSLLLWLNSQPKIQLLGFHFSSDAERLQRLAAADWTQVRDLQREARCHARVLFQNGHMPGLRRLCEVYLGKLLDKSLQCSNWDQRPLSAEQIRYAGSDAAVLLDIAEAMDAEQEETKERIVLADTSLERLSEGPWKGVTCILLPVPEALFDLVVAAEPMGYVDLSEYSSALRPFIRRRAKEDERKLDQVQLLCVERRERLEDARDELYSAGYYLADHDEVHGWCDGCEEHRCGQTTLFDPVLMTPEAQIEMLIGQRSRGSPRSIGDERVLPVAYEVGKPSAELLLVWLPGNTEASHSEGG
ncbi:Exonuclease mut-7 homolog (Exonuclease 3'-5' domain-containing protein 3) [Durusdinium trenchii]|uniref:Exonuclease mut-7 homolog (Exonuclease 3'-5' domain-containing protein 3) n=1 Tax=Durusdinium trenchii TaxID=1381693 RepID=A0ABP0KDW3_9DINO